MEWNGLSYVRVWSMRAPGLGTGGGGFDLPPEAIEHLAGTANTIHIRVAGDESRSVTLRPGVVWPLQQLSRRSLTARSTASTTPAIARVTWAGDPEVIDAMATRGCRPRRRAPARAPPEASANLRQGRLYVASGNAKGLHLVSGKRCELHRGQPAPVEVWLGKLLLSSAIS